MKPTSKKKEQRHAVSTDGRTREPDRVRLRSTRIATLPAAALGPPIADLLKKIKRIDRAIHPSVYIRQVEEEQRGRYVHEIRRQAARGSVEATKALKANKF